MAWEFVADGTGTNINDVVALEKNDILEGQKAMLDIVTVAPMSTFEVNDIRDSLMWAGVNDLQVSGSGNRLQITWRKGFPWAAIIILAIVAVIAIAIWQLLKWVIPAVPPPILNFTLIAAGVLGLAVAYKMIRRN
ncbi:MAG: hypothetical protein M0R06_16115 [Sphaerochaeta sp.]|jgi:hypothetical protein|nr:hypothetical protein [Sphaerochaeta sp.]